MFFRTTQVMQCMYVWTWFLMCVFVYLLIRRD
jgi:hypothetical protein